jgi:hypothetical protein
MKMRSRTYDNDDDSYLWRKRENAPCTVTFFMMVGSGAMGQAVLVN